MREFLREEEGVLRDKGGGGRHFKGGSRFDREGVVGEKNNLSKMGKKEGLGALIVMCCR